MSKKIKVVVEMTEPQEVGLFGASQGKVTIGEYMLQVALDRPRILRWVKDEIALLERDERYQAKAARLDANAPLALIQTAMHERHNTLSQVLELFGGSY